MDKGNMFNDVYNVIRKNLILLIIVILAAAIAGAIFSSEAFMKPRFKSTAAVYPINTIPHSDESETEQMLQIFGSEAIKESVLNTFELWTRWDDLIPGTPEYNHWSNELYQERVSIGPTRYESVEIVCQDEDPEVAQKMAEHIIDKFNEVARQMDRDIHLKYFEMKEYEQKNLNLVIDSLEARMQELRMKGGLLDFESQSERVTEGYLRMLSSGGSTAKLDEVKALMANLAKDGSELEVLQEMVKELNVYYTILTQERIQAKAKANSELDYASVVVAPQVADKKTYPVRWIIVLLSMIMAAVAALVFLILRERLARQEG
jgi:uncharacterized protein involved in exopolysaccharide biosynthesis